MKNIFLIGIYKERGIEPLFPFRVHIQEPVLIVSVVQQSWKILGSHRLTLIVQNILKLNRGQIIFSIHVCFWEMVTSFQRMQNF